MKNAVVLATAVVAAVILIQGAGPSVTAVPSRASVDLVASSPSTHTVQTRLTAMLGAKTTTAAVAAKSATTTSAAGSSAPASSATPTAAPTVQATAAAATTGTSVTAGRTFTTTPAPVVVAPAPAPPPAAPACASAIGGSTAGAPGAADAEGVPGTSSQDLADFASQYNAIRVANCLQPIPYAHIQYSSCLQQRLWWMADDPSTDPASAFGHTGTAVRSDGVPIVGCDGDLAEGNGFTASSVATAWWGSPDHRTSLFQPTYPGSLAGVCIAFAITHGGINVPAPNEPASFVRAAAYWYDC